MKMKLIHSVAEESFSVPSDMADVLGLSHAAYYTLVDDDECDYALTARQEAALLDVTAKISSPAVAEIRNILSRAKIEAMAAPSPSPGLLGSARLYKRILLMAREVGISPVGVERAMVAVLKTALEENMTIEDVIALCLDNPKP